MHCLLIGPVRQTAVLLRTDPVLRWRVNLGTLYILINQSDIFTVQARQQLAS